MAAEINASVIAEVEGCKKPSEVQDADLEMTNIMIPRRSCVGTIHKVRLGKDLIQRQSINGAQSNFREYGYPANENSPISITEATLDWFNDPFSVVDFVSNMGMVPNTNPKGIPCKKNRNMSSPRP